MKTFLEFYFTELGGKVIIDRVGLNNKTGKKFLLRFGFECIKISKDEIIMKMIKERFMELYKKEVKNG